VGLIDGQIVACVMAVTKAPRLAELSIDRPRTSRRGYARAIVNEAERLLREAGCPKINLQVRTSNHRMIEVYRKLGYSVDEVTSMGKRLEHDDGTG